MTQTPSVVAALLLLAALAGVRGAAAQDSVHVLAPSDTTVPAPTGGTLVVRDLGPARPGRLLRNALAGAHDTWVRRPADSALALPRYATLPRGVVVLGGDVTVASTVRGDVVVVDGDLFLHPGAVIEGRAIVIGGGLYDSRLALVRGERIVYRDVTFTSSAAGGDTLALAYQDLGGAVPPLIAFPVYGLRLPAYDRIDGLSVGFGPTITLEEGQTEIEPSLTYRSHLGEIDPSVAAVKRFGRLTDVRLFAGRDTRSNDRWIRNDVVNSLTSLIGGADTRNHYRADRAELGAAHRWERELSTHEGYAGLATERSWSAERDTSSESAPWSAFRKRDRVIGMLRPNPAIDRGRISSVLAGLSSEYERPDLRVSGGARLEGAFDTPQVYDGGDVVKSSRFLQATLDTRLGFPTFRGQSFALAAHGVVTAADATPRQRWAYVGGAGTLVTEDLLSRGGDQLLFVESEYFVPVNRVQVPFIGTPTLILRHAVGGAAVSAFPRLVQNLGVALVLGPLRVDFSIDPESRRTRTSISPSLMR